MRILRKETTYPDTPKLVHKTFLLGLRVFLVLRYDAAIDGLVNVLLLTLSLVLYVEGNFRTQRASRRRLLTFATFVTSSTLR